MTLFGRDNDSFVQWRFSSNNGFPGVPSNSGFVIEKRSGGDLLGHFWHKPELLALCCTSHWGEQLGDSRFSRVHR